MNLDDVYYVQKDFKIYSNIIIHYIGKNISIFYSNLTSIISNCIFTIYEPLIIKSLINLNYFYFDNIDINIIRENCYSILSENCENTPVSHAIHARKDVLWNSIFEYVTQNSRIYLDGFINFRLYKYIQYLDSIIDFTVNKYIVDKEYSEFINLLKMYIDSQDSKIPLIHLIYVNNEAILLDENKNIISLTKNNLELHYLSDISFSSNDYALNTLLSLLPKKIIIHLISPEDDFIRTLNLIFSNRLSICTSCNICKTYSLISNI